VFAPIYVTLDNAGSISGTSGAALANTGGYSVQFTRITNRATGTIGAIAGTFGIIQNDGLIDGGAMAAIDTAGGYITGTVNNTGTIRSANGVATIANTQLTLNNSGTVSNTGGGAAIGSTGWARSSTRRVAPSPPMAQRRFRPRATSRSTIWVRWTTQGSAAPRSAAARWASATGSVR
jgi:hypothetical protein